MEARRTPDPLDLTALASVYANATDAAAVVAQAYDRAAGGDAAVWIALADRDQVLAQAAAVAGRDELPLRGVPFAVKDNIDVAGMPTTAGCAAFSYTPQRSATAVERLQQAGAVLIGKTNLDQFATGLVGTRSPFGVPANRFDPLLIPGGSSSGSAVAVARSMVSFALGTDTAGSGRVPAAYSGIVGLKPTRGLVSTAGVVPACRSLDCVSIFATSVQDAQAILGVVAAVDPRDPYSRPAPAAGAGVTAGAAAAATPLRVGILAPKARQFFGNAAYASAYAAALEQLVGHGHTLHEVDFEPFREAAALLYSGPWVAERLAAVTPFIDQQPEALLPVTRGIIEAGRDLSAADYFRASYRLQELRQAAAQTWQVADVLALPTAGTIYSLADVAADPIGTNTNLGYYTNFVNLLDMCALAVPAAAVDRQTAPPFGLTLLAPAFQDALLAPVAAQLHASYGGPEWRQQGPHTSAPAATVPAADEGYLDLAVFGLHLQGQPLNPQLSDLGATLVRTGRTSDAYRLVRIAGSTAPAAAGTPAALDKPGAIRGAAGSGRPIELEIWRVPQAGVGPFLAKIPPPLGLGTVELENGETVKGFICEQWIAPSAEDITELGGWRAYLATR